MQTSNRTMWIIGTCAFICLLILGTWIFQHVMPIEPDIKPAALQETGIKPYASISTGVQDLSASVPDEKVSLRHYQEGYQRFNSQHFLIGPGKQVVQTKAGLKLHIDPSVLEHKDGRPVTGNLVVRISDVNNSRELFKQQAATVSNGRLLMSGGTYHISIESGSELLRIKKGKSLDIHFPVMPWVSKAKGRVNMELFYGNRDSMNNMNWERAGVPVYLEAAPDAERVGFNISTVARGNGGFNDWLDVDDPIAKVKGKMVFKSMQAPVHYYGSKITLKQLLDSVNANREIIYLDSVSFWPRNLPTNKRLDTNHLVHLYGPRFQYLIRKHGDTIATETKQTMTVQAAAPETNFADQLAAYYNPVAINRLGWINVDRFYDYSPPTFFYVQADSLFRHSVVSYFFMFDRFNGLVNGEILVSADGSVQFTQMPDGQPVTLVAFLKKNGIVYHAKLQCNISKTEKPKLEFREIRPAELNKIFGRNIRV